MSCRELLCRCSCNKYACRPSVTVTNTAAAQICLLVECCCKMDACWTVATQSACWLIFCHSILHVCWRCASLSAIPADMVSHYQPCLLVWYLTISRACWRDTSLQVKPFCNKLPFWRPFCLHSYFIFIFFFVRS